MSGSARVVKFFIPDHAVFAFASVTEILKKYWVALVSPVSCTSKWVASGAVPEVWF